MKTLKKRLLSFATCKALIFSMLAFLPDMFSINAKAFTEKTSCGGNSDSLWTYIRQCPYYNAKAECTIYAWSRVYQITGKLPAGLNGLGNAAIGIKIVQHIRKIKQILKWEMLFVGEEIIT